MLHKHILFAVIAIILSSIQCLYAHNAAFPLPNDKIDEYPFNMVGKVSSGDFVGSGVAISQKVVLSAAHVFFDDEKLDWFSSPFKWNRQHSPSNTFFRMSARSYRFFSDYAEATRRFGNDDETTSWEQFNLDAICLIFFEEVANGGNAGWGTNYITENINKMIIGYPHINYSNFDSRLDMMHSTSLSGSSANYELVNYIDRLGFARNVYLTYDLSAGPGSSGGPLYGRIAYADGSIDWGVIGIHVGGTVGEDSVDLNIDEGVSDLIKDSVSDTTTTPSDDHGDSRHTATFIDLNSTTSGSIEAESDIDYFRIELIRAGTITAFTTGNTDTLGTLQNVSGNVIITNDDSGSDRNFLIKRELNPGTYYIEISHFSNEETGNYTFQIDYAEAINLPDLVVDSVNVASMSVTAGQKIRVDFDRSNIGSEDAVGFSQRLYLSENETITTFDTLLVDFAKKDMSAGTSQNLFFEVIIPEDTTPGTYYIGYILDADREIKETDESNNSGYVEITVTSSFTDDDDANRLNLVLDGSGDIAGENIRHPNGNVFDQVLLTGQSIALQAKPGQITRVSFMDINQDIVQVEFSGEGTFTVSLDPGSFLPASLPSRYNQDVMYVTGKPTVVIEGADSNTFFSIFTVGTINAVNQALFPDGQVYDAKADVKLVEVTNSTGFGGMQFSNTVFSGSTGKVGIDARGIPISVRLTIGDIDASGDAVPYLLFGDGSFTVPAGNPGLRITGGDLTQTNGASIVVAESGSTTPGFETLITQNNFKSDNTPQPTLSINATFSNEDGDDITVAVDEITIE